MRASDRPPSFVCIRFIFDAITTSARACCIRIRRFNGITSFDELMCASEWASEWVSSLFVYSDSLARSPGPIRNALPSVLTSLSKSLLECEPTSDEHAIRTAMGMSMRERCTNKTDVNGFNFKCIECSYGIKKNHNFNSIIVILLSERERERVHTAHARCNDLSCSFNHRTCS